MLLSSSWMETVELLFWKQRKSWRQQIVWAVQNRDRISLNTRSANIYKWKHKFIRTSETRAFNAVKWEPFEFRSFPISPLLWQGGSTCWVGSPGRKGSRWWGSWVWEWFPPRRWLLLDPHLLLLLRSPLQKDSCRQEILRDLSSVGWTAPLRLKASHPAQRKTSSHHCHTDQNPQLMTNIIKQGSLFSHTIFLVLDQWNNLHLQGTSSKSAFYLCHSYNKVHSCYML